MKHVPLALALLLVGIVAGCREKGNSDASAANNAPASVTNIPSYLVLGVIKSIELDAKTVTIQHEKIPNYMAAMTMPFKVKDTNELQHVQPGDRIAFRLWVAADESWIDKLIKAPPAASWDGTAPTPETNAPPEREAVRVVRDVDPLNVGDVMPNYTFTNELGRTVSLHDFKGQALAFTFIYTRCPLPDFCPRMSRNFSEVYQRLTSQANAPTNWHLLTISFDPHYDTPGILRAYARAFEANPDRWNFLTGAMEDIDAITDQFNLAIMKRGNDWDHKIRTVVIDAAGRVQKIIYGNEWKPEELLDEIIKASKAPPGPAAGG
ncbi:MAG: SCO family protein [Verrucomicrobiota bacterium]